MDSSTETSLCTIPETQLTEEQKLRAEENRNKAIQRKRKRIENKV